MEKSPEKHNKSKKKPLSDYGRYSGIAIQMLSIILVGTFAGIMLDKWLKLKFPVFTLILILFSVIMAMYVIIKDVTKKK
jgi:ATP synthase protein I